MPRKRKKVVKKKRHGSIADIVSPRIVVPSSQTTQNVLALNTANNGGQVENDFDYTPYSSGNITNKLFLEVDIAFDPSLLTDIAGKGSGELALVYFTPSNYRFETPPRIGFLYLSILLDSTGILGWYYVFAIGDKFNGEFGQSPTLSKTIIGNKWYHFASKIDMTTDPVTLDFSIDEDAIPNYSFSSGNVIPDIEYIDLTENSPASLGVNQFVYFNNLKVGTTLGGDDLINDPFETLGAPDPNIWNSWVWDAEIISKSGIL